MCLKGDYQKTKLKRNSNRNALAVLKKPFFFRSSSVLNVYIFFIFICFSYLNHRNATQVALSVFKDRTLKHLALWLCVVILRLRLWLMLWLTAVLNCGFSCLSLKVTHLGMMVLKRSPLYDPINLLSLNLTRNAQ